MDGTSRPVEDNTVDPYRGTPLGVEAAWCPNGIQLPVIAAERVWGVLSVRDLKLLFP